MSKQYLLRPFFKVTTPPSLIPPQPLRAFATPIARNSAPANLLASTRPRLEHLAPAPSNFIGLPLSQATKRLNIPLMEPLELQIAPDPPAALSLFTAGFVKRLALMDVVTGGGPYSRPWGEYEVVSCDSENDEVEEVKAASFDDPTPTPLTLAAP